MAVAGRRPDTVKVRRQEEFCDGMFCFIIVTSDYCLKRTVCISLAAIIIWVKKKQCKAYMIIHFLMFFFILSCCFVQ